MPLSQAIKATAPKVAQTQLDIVEDKLDWLISQLKGVKSISVGVANEDIEALKAHLKTVSDAVTALSNPPVAVVSATTNVAPTVVPTA